MIKIIGNSKVLKSMELPAKLFGDITRLVGFTPFYTVHLHTSIDECNPPYIWHEISHVLQKMKYGLFYWIRTYVSDYVKNMVHMSPSEAYKNIRWEKESYNIKDMRTLLYYYPEYIHEIIETQKFYNLRIS